MTQPAPASLQLLVLNEIQKVFDDAVSHTQIRRTGLSLLPTENILSPLAMRLLGSDLVNRYYTLDGDCDLEYPRTEHLRAIENIAKSAIARLFDVGCVNVRPISGLSGMLVAAASLTGPGAVAYTLSTHDGGHACTAAIMARLGVRVLHLPFNTADLTVDLERSARQFKAVPPDIIYIDHTNVLFPLDTESLRDISPPETAIHYDCSQLLGLMADTEYFKPLSNGATSVGASTHKTFPGPQKAILMTNDRNIDTRFDAAADVFISNHHLNSVAALAVSALEMLLYGRDYSRMVRANARALGEALLGNDIHVHSARGAVSGSHQLWLDTAPDDSMPSVIRRLSETSIVVNHARMPSQKGMKGIRIGTTGVTRLGMGQEEMIEIAKLVSDVMLRRRDPEAVKRDVAALAVSFQTVHYCLSSS